MSKRTGSNILFWTCAIFLFIVSCDHLHTKEYFVVNDLDDSIKVKYTLLKGTEIKSIASKTTELLYVNEYVFGSVGVSDERYDDNISNISATRDSVYHQIGEARWEYREEDKYHAIYTMRIDTTILP
jgi:hypothetical protein